MPTITQLPLAGSVSAADMIPISQAGSAHAVSAGALLLAAQPVITIQPPSLLGRTSLGSGGPEQIDVGIGLLLSSGTLVANGADHATYPSTSGLALGSDLIISSQGSPMLMPTTSLRGLFSAGQNVSIDDNGVISAVASGTLSPTALLGSAIGTLQVVSSVTAQDLVPISQADDDCSIKYSDFLNGITIDEAPAAAPASDSDTLWVAQSTNAMQRQSFSAIWTWITAKIPAYKNPVLEINQNTGLTAINHNGRVLVCSQPVTITPSTTNMGNGFQCQLVNLSNGNVTLANGFLTSTGSSVIGPQQMAIVQCLEYSAGTVAYAALPPLSSAVTIPGQVAGLVTSNVTPTSVTANWQQPSNGGVPSFYTIQYRVSGSTAWITGGAAVLGTSYQLSGLQPNTSYDIEVAACNGAGTGAASAILTISTTAAGQPSVPPQVTGLIAVTVSNSDIGLSWSGQSGTNAATSYTAQYRPTGSSVWTSSLSGVTANSVDISGLQPATSYDFSVYGVNANGVGASSAVVSATTAATGTAVSAISWNMTPSGTYARASGTIGINAHISPSTAAVQFGFSTSGTVPPTSWTAGNHVNTDLWGAYVPAPSTAGNWYAWVEGTDGSNPTVFPTPFVVQ